MNEKVQKSILNKALRYCEQRSLGYKDGGSDEITPRTIEDVRQVLAEILYGYAPFKRTDEANYAFDDGYDVGFLDGLLWALKK